VRALTVQQPWAWAIVHGGKDVENRTRNLAGSYRGPVAIHAGLREDLSALDDAVLLSALFPRGEIEPLADPKPLATRGSILGVADLVAVHHDSDHGPGAPCSAWGQRAAWHLRFANARPLEVPIPAKGRLGLWTPDAELRALIELNLGAAEWVDEIRERGSE
jgi:hypothetical protein